MTTRSFPTPRHPARTLAWAAALALGSWAAQADTVNGANLKVTLDALPGTFSQVVTQGAAGHSILTLSWTGLYNGTGCGGLCPTGAATFVQGVAPGLSKYSSFDLFTTMAVAPLAGWQVNAITYRLGARQTGESTATANGGNPNNAIYSLYQGSNGSARVDYGISAAPTLDALPAMANGVVNSSVAGATLRFDRVNNPVTRDGAAGTGSVTSFGTATPGADTGQGVSAGRGLAAWSSGATTAYEYGHAQISLVQALSVDQLDASGQVMSSTNGWRSAFSLMPVFSGSASVLGNAEASLALGSVSISFDVSQAVPPVPVPEPSSWMLLAAGGAWVWFASRRRR
ncbi:PEP-CTERM sorting domain-containing protein [Roseateles sp. BYS87W]|uniref:PEP-CTERM sorting domain-containing protein n=1 Tax=Pelomonas baiyunensis TaxID=3299026 RepID=A0ABW7H2R2_9BURK